MERELLLLGLLRKHEMHGYQLLEFIDSQMASCVDLKKPTAYFLLEKMAVAGWIHADQTHEGNRPPRRVYRITAEGEAAFQRLLRENLGGYALTVFISDVGLAFIGELPDDEALALLEKRREAVEASIAAIKAVPLHEGGAQLMIEHQAHHLASELEWVSRIIARTKQQTKKKTKSGMSGHAQQPH